MSNTEFERYHELAFAKRPAEELYDLAADPGQIVNVAEDKKYAEVRKKLRDDLGAARIVLKEGNFLAYESKGRLIYERLRETWEHAVEEILLNSVVVRFGDSVQTNRLKRLTDIVDNDIETVTVEMSRCSDFVHDQAGALHTSVPEPQIVESDISKLADWVKELSGKRGRG